MNPMTRLRRAINDNEDGHALHAHCDNLDIEHEGLLQKSYALEADNASLRTRVKELEGENAALKSDVLNSFSAWEILDGSLNRIIAELSAKARQGRRVRETEGGLSEKEKMALYRYMRRKQKKPPTGHGRGE